MKGLNCKSAGISVFKQFQEDFFLFLTSFVVVLGVFWGYLFRCVFMILVCIYLSI